MGTTTFDCDCCKQLCCGCDVPLTLFATFTDITGDCVDCIDPTSVTLTREPDICTWTAESANVNCPGSGAHDYVQVLCLGGEWFFSATCGRSATLVSVQCDPFVLVFDVTAAGGSQPSTCCAPGGGTFTVTFTG